MYSTFIVTLAALATAQQLWPPPRPSGPTRILNITMPIPDFNRVKNIYGWVVPVTESDRTTIGLYCHTSTEWVRFDPCTDVPSIKVIVAPKASSTVAFMITDVVGGISKDLFTADCTFKPKDATCSVTATLVVMTTSPRFTSELTTTITIGESWTSEISVFPVTITDGAARLGPEPTGEEGGAAPSNTGAPGNSGAASSNPGAPIVMAGAILVGIAAVVVAL